MIYRPFVLSWHTYRTIKERIPDNRDVVKSIIGLLEGRSWCHKMYDRWTMRSITENRDNWFRLFFHCFININAVKMLVSPHTSFSDRRNKKKRNRHNEINKLDYDAHTTCLIIAVGVLLRNPLFKIRGFFNWFFNYLRNLA